MSVLVALWLLTSVFIDTNLFFEQIELFNK